VSTIDEGAPHHDEWRRRRILAGAWQMSSGCPTNASCRWGSQAVVVGGRAGSDMAARKE
jgi:hypothetical protein